MTSLIRKEGANQVKSLFSKIAQGALCAMLCVAAVAEEKKPEPVPAITDAHRAQFFKAQLQVNQAQAAMTAAQQTMQAAVTDLPKDCGEKFQPQMDPAGDPVCVAKPEPAKPAEKK